METSRLAEDPEGIAKQHALLNERISNGGVPKVNLPGYPVLYVKDMEFAKSMLFSKTDVLPKRIVEGSYNVRFFTESAVPQLTLLLQMSGGDPTVKTLSTIQDTTPFVKALRRCYLFTMDSANLKIMVPKVNRVIDQLIDRIESTREKGSVDVQHLCVSFTLDVIGQVAFDVNLGGLDGSKDLHRLLIEVGYIVIDGVLNPLKKLYCTLFPRSSVARAQKENIRLLTAEWDNIAEDVLRREDPPEGELPLWHALRTFVDPETGKRLPYKDFRSELASMVVGGMDSTGHQLAWILALLAEHPRVAEKILQQLKENGLYGPEAREPTFEDLTDLTYLTAVVKEGMRVCTVVIGSFHRVTVKDTTILGYRVPKGTQIALPGNRWMHSEDDWEDAATFKPERWLTGEDMSLKHYLGFSYGPRDCIGQRLAMLELRLAILRLVQRYTFSLPIPFEDLMMNARNGIVIEAIDGIWMHVQPRSA